ncbi:hypothetical protein ANRL3_00658 [Anaerolineae bacterium]|nr:hypothetical protein ANRL3_00658 [Anaerolineae bacterium]
MDEREYFVPLPSDAMLRVRYQKDRGRILRFTVQLEAYIEDVWMPITRYDTSHRFVHRDDLKPDGSQIKSPPMSFANYADALNYAIRDLRLNHQLYIERFLEWKR